MLTTDQKENLINHFFDHVRQDLCKDDHNRDLIATFIRERTAGLAMLNLAALQWAAAELAGKLHYYQHVDVSAQLAAGADAQKQLAVQQAEKNRKSEELRKQIERQARQDANQPGVSSAYSGRVDAAAEEARAREEQAQRAQTQLQHSAFLAELRDAELHQEITNGMVNWARTNDARHRMKENLKRKYPQFFSEVQ
jgi:hypothetical protein